MHPPDFLGCATRQHVVDHLRWESKTSCRRLTFKLTGKQERPSCLPQLASMSLTTCVFCEHDVKKHPRPPQAPPLQHSYTVHSLRSPLATSLAPSASCLPHRLHLALFEAAGAPQPAQQLLHSAARGQQTGQPANWSVSKLVSESLQVLGRAALPALMWEPPAQLSGGRVF